ncbi:MAG: hypothetical protein CL526_10585 [Aequorivita sp.]|nr:hypothetical protein [Aequorivita sp.]|tara:strand:- start:29571 stop:30113 length:543 start_codon:yes stop_codon:yes gene_type:complete
MKKATFLSLAIVAITAFSCKENSKQAEPEVVTVETTKAKTYELANANVEFNSPEVEKAFNQYLEVEAALVNTNAKNTAQAATNLEATLKAMNAEEATVTAVSSIANSEDINIQRQHFETLSAAIETMVSGALESGTLYKQYCPMAFNNKGASWISASKDILNPYFGDKMLKCGRVEAEIK